MFKYVIGHEKQGVTEKLTKTESAYVTTLATYVNKALSRGDKIQHHLHQSELMSLEKLERRIGQGPETEVSQKLRKRDEVHNKVGMMLDAIRKKTDFFRPCVPHQRQQTGQRILAQVCELWAKLRWQKERRASGYKYTNMIENLNKHGPKRLERCQKINK